MFEFLDKLFRRTNQQDGSRIPPQPPNHHKPNSPNLPPYIKRGDEGRLAPRSWDLGYELEVDGIVAAYLDSADVKTGFAVHFGAFHSAVCGRQSRLHTRYNSSATLDVPWRSPAHFAPGEVKPVVGIGTQSHAIGEIHRGAGFGGDIGTFVHKNVPRQLLTRRSLRIGAVCPPIPRPLL